ncbi:MAG: hypothetical protein V4487_07755, partial [Chlamydiota bacterium]
MGTIPPQNSQQRTPIYIGPGDTRLWVPNQRIRNLPPREASTEQKTSYLMENKQLVLENVRLKDTIRDQEEALKKFSEMGTLQDLTSLKSAHQRLVLENKRLLKTKVTQRESL